MKNGYDDLEKREFKRIKLKFQVELENLKTHRLLSLISSDISVGGLGISRLAPEGMDIFTEEELLPETPVSIRIILPGCESEIVLKGEVTWSERFKTGVWKAGIEFERPQVEINRYYIVDQDEGVAARRGSKRYNRLFQVDIRKIGSRENHIGLSANLSSKGMQLFSETLFSTDTPIEVRIRIFGSNETMIVKAKVVWTRPEKENTWRMGVVFDEPLPLVKLKNL